jgi:hypothetical protein
MTEDLNTNEELELMSVIMTEDLVKSNEELGLLCSRNNSIEEAEHFRNGSEELIIKNHVFKFYC